MTDAHHACGHYVALKDVTNRQKGQNMKQLIFSSVLLTLLAGPAFAQHDSHSSAAAMSPASKDMPAYVRENMEAMDRMHGPMMEAAKLADPDEAFVRSMIPHHQGAIDMARIELKYGKDAVAKKFAEDVIREQTREINEMTAWLKARAK
jgi:uncharacterized protein (DUF305 family)